MIYGLFLSSTAIAFVEESYASLPQYGARHIVQRPSHIR
jgi:hypothetical protein